jgi:hypothetical protein
MGVDCVLSGGRRLGDELHASHHLPSSEKRDVRRKENEAITSALHMKIKKLFPLDYTTGFTTV